MITPIHFAIDLEPDARLPSASDKSFDSASVGFASMASLREEMEKATGAPANFGWYLRMDRHIAALYGDACAIARRYSAELDHIMASGDEVGLHIHSMEKTRNENWRVNYADETLLADTIDEAFATYEDFFEHSCRAVRMGDMWTSEKTMRRLALNGAHYDISLESGVRPMHYTGLYRGTDSKGWRPSTMGAPLRPFQPFSGDVTSGHLWALPLSSYPRTDRRRPGMWIVSAYSALATGFRRVRARNVLRPQAFKHRQEMESAVKAALVENDQPGLCVAVRNFGAEDRILAFFDILREIAGERPLRFCTPRDYVRLAAAD